MLTNVWKAVFYGLFYLIVQWNMNQCILTKAIMVATPIIAPITIFSTWDMIANVQCSNTHKLSSCRCLSRGTEYLQAKEHNTGRSVDDVLSHMAAETILKIFISRKLIHLGNWSGRKQLSLNVLSMKINLWRDK